ncbi:MAG: hypothetical protein ACYCVH_08890 [Ignavibacteriaceae bacterium]
MTYTIIYEKVSDASFPKGYFYAHIPSLDLTTHGLEIEVQKKPLKNCLEFRLKKKELTAKMYRWRKNLFIRK